MPEIYVEGVPSWDIHHVYDKCWPFLERALARAPEVAGKHTKQSLMRALCEKRSQLWIVWDDNEREFIAAIMTEITNPEEYPGAKCLEVPLIGGKRLKEWSARIMDILSRWGLEHGCTHMVGYGRKGWIRHYGFKEFGRTKDGILIMTKLLGNN